VLCDWLRLAALRSEQAPSTAYGELNPLLAPCLRTLARLAGELVRLTGSAVVEMNRAIAVAEAEGAEAGLAIVDRLDLDGYQYFHSTRADLLRRLGRAVEARAEYECALNLAHAEPERRFLQRRIVEVGA